MFYHTGAKKVNTDETSPGPVRWPYGHAPQPPGAAAARMSLTLSGESNRKRQRFLRGERIRPIAVCYADRHGGAAVSANGTNRVHLVLPGSLVEEVDTLVGTRKRSRFIATAVESAISARRRGGSGTVAMRPSSRRSDDDWRRGAENMRTHVVLAAHTLDDLDAEVSAGERSRFVAEAVERELRRRELLQLAEELAGSLAEVDIPGWETPESTSRWVRELRQEADRQRDPWRASEPA